MHVWQRPILLSKTNARVRSIKIAADIKHREPVIENYKLFH